MKRLLVVTADDFGFSAERNKGIIETFQKGGVKSASILLNCTGTTEAIDARKHGICLGLHLNLTEGEPIGSKTYTTLTVDGIFRGKGGTRQALEEGIVDQKEVVSEIESQIERFKELTGNVPDYVDGHQHIHLHPAVVKTFACSLKRHDIKMTRVPVEINMEKRMQSRQNFSFLYQVIEESKAALPTLDSYGIRSTDTFMGLSTMGRNMTISSLQEGILEAFLYAEERRQQAPRPTKEAGLEDEGTVSCELMTHPGYPTRPDFGGFSWGTDEFGMSDDRPYEMRILTAEDMNAFYKENHIELVSHKTLL